MTKSAGRGLDWLALVLVCASAVLCGLLELFFLSEFYVGSVIVPVVVLAALASNVVLPLLGFACVGVVRGAVLPVLAWLVTVLVLTAYNRPEGDAIVLALYHQDLAFYGVVLVGAVAGFSSVLRAVGRTRPPVPARTGPGRRPTR